MNPNIIAEWLLTLIAGHPHLPATLENRIFPDQAPRGTTNPCLVYQVIGAEFDQDIDDNPAEEGTISIQLRAYAGTRRDANTIRERLRFLLTAKGIIGGQSFVDADEATQEFRVLNTQISSYTDTFDEGSNDNGDDFGALCLWTLTASE